MKKVLKAAISSLFDAQSEHVSFNDTKRGFSVFFFDIKAVEVALLKTKSYFVFGPGLDGERVPFQDAFFIQDEKQRFFASFEECKNMRVQMDENAADSFGCCNDFLKCSDARACVHQDDKFYLGCIYRKNLESGKIFYGRNRNV